MIIFIKLPIQIILTEQSLIQQLFKVMKALNEEGDFWQVLIVADHMTALNEEGNFWQVLIVAGHIIAVWALSNQFTIMTSQSPTVSWSPFVNDK